MPRGNGKHAQQAKAQPVGLAAFIKPKSGIDEQHNYEYVDWAEVNPQLLVGAVVSAVQQGGALLLGCSRDKKSYSVKVYVGGEGTPFYFPCNPSGVEQLEEFLQGIIYSAEYGGFPSE